VLAHVNVNELFGNTRARWLVTGCAGFIGSNLCSALLSANQTVIGMDNLSTGHMANVDWVKSVADGYEGSFEFLNADITDAAACSKACDGVDYVLHQAALGSVPRSIQTPLLSHASNVDGFVKILDAARVASVKRFVYASSSSIYGDNTDLPKVETRTGAVLSPYAATKAINETYAGVFQKCYGLQTVGLRYFNVFGPRQDPDGAYAAVIPRWIQRVLAGQPIDIYGDGSVSRDFCFIANVVQANVRVALNLAQSATANVFNVACGSRTSLNELADVIEIIAQEKPNSFQGAASSGVVRNYLPARFGDIAHSLADISAVSNAVAYTPTHSLADGLVETVRWYLANKKSVLV
jgi:UDP-N-acetylglucosamine/UDP-N-acetylgalactosamine 4-epimerase